MVVGGLILKLHVYWKYLLCLIFAHTAFALGTVVLWSTVSQKSTFFTGLRLPIGRRWVASRFLGAVSAVAVQTYPRVTVLGAV